MSAHRLRATNHDTHIHELMAGANGNPRVQFIVVVQEESGQNCWGPQMALSTPGAGANDDSCFSGGTNETQSRAMLVFFDATGREIGKFKFPHNPPTNGTLKTLIATQEFADLPGAPTPDIIMPPLLNPISGKVCFKNNPLNTVFSRNQCVSYGSFTGATESNESGVAAGPPAPALSVVNTVSLISTVDTDRNSDFTLATTPTPINIAGGTFTMPVLSQAAQGENLFSNDSFLGNGRTCASCHVANQSFGLKPDNITSRFTTLATTFDPQFIGEIAPSLFDAGFDFNLNTLVLTAEVASPAPCTGELRGIITTGGGGKAKVLTRVSPTTYLVYGGRSPILSGAVSDTNSCTGTVASITAGSLNNLESPLRMRTSVNPGFPQGRALILENIDGFPNPNVFRKSPHLLNLSRSGPFGFGGDIPDLRTFATNAVQQHFPRTLARNASGTNPDFRLPTIAETAAIEAFMQTQELPPGSGTSKFDLNLFAITAAQQRGRDAFFGEAKCSQCHGGPVLAQTTVAILDQPIGINGVFNTGVVNQPINGPAVDNLPCEPTVGVCGSRKFSTPQLFNVKNLAPLFHDASVNTVKQAVDFYTSAAFNNSPAGVAIGGIALSVAMEDDITAFLEGLTFQSISANSSTSLSGVPGTAVSPAPSVVVRDKDGNPISGVQITFAVKSGGGSLTGATQTTNASGIATVGSWIIAPGGSALTATATGTFAGNSVKFTATGVLTTNDSFANRITLAGNSITTTGANFGFTAEPGEPDDLINFTTGLPSAWWTWTAPCTFTVTQPTSFIDTNGSSFDTVLGVFTGPSLGSLTRIASDDNTGNGSTTSRVPSTSPGPTSIPVAAGTVFQIRVRGKSATNVGNITLHINAPSCAAVAPTLVSVGPSSGAQSTSVNVSLSGTNFVSGGTTVAVSGTNVSVSNVKVANANFLTATLALASGAALGGRNITVTAAGLTSSAATFTVTPPAPTLISVTPIDGIQGTNVNVTLAGTNFVTGASTIAVNGVDVTVSNVNVASATSMTATFTVAADALLGAHVVTVETASGVSGPVTFTVQPPGPTLTTITPTTGVQNTNVNVTITGTNFVPNGTNVAVNGNGVTVSNVNVTTSTSLTATFAIASGATLGAHSVTAMSSSGTSNSVAFTVLPPAPTLTSVSPSTGIQNTNVLVTLTGTNFVAGMTVDAGADITVTLPTVSSATLATTTLTIGSAALGPRSMTVTTSGGTSAVNAGLFLVLPPPPILTSVNPPTGNQNTNVSVTLVGVNFVPAGTIVAVSGIGVTVSNVNVLSSTSLTVTFAVAAGATLGAHSVTATTASGSSNPVTFTVVPPVPTLTSVAPATGVQNTSLLVTLTGTDFVAGMTIDAGANITATAPTVSSAMLATTTLTIGAAALGPRSITVTTTGGTSAVNTGLFTVLPPAPTLTGITPSTGVQGTNIPITLTGTNFVPGGTTTLVISGIGVTASNIDVLTSTTMTATFAVAPGATLGGRNVSVATSGGTSSSVVWTVLPPLPTLTSISPNACVKGTSCSVTLTGTNFISGGTTVGVSGTGVVVTNVTFVSATSMTALFTVDAAAVTSPRSVTVTTVGGTSLLVIFNIADPFPDLTVSSSHTGNFGAGFSEAYSLLVSNVGLVSTGTAMTVTDTLPSGLSFVSGSGSGWSCAASGQSVACTRSAVLAAAASTTIGLTVAVENSAAASVINSATVSTTEDLNSANNTGTDITTVVAAPVPAFTFTPNPLAAGQQATLALTIPTAFPHDVNGILTLVFSSTAAIPVDDPAIQFATGGRLVAFTVAANTTQARFAGSTAPGPIGFQTGTVAGTLTFGGTLTSGTIQVAFPSPASGGNMTIPKLAPQIQASQITAQTGGFTTAITFMSTMREVTQLIITFNVTPTIKPSCGTLTGCSVSGSAITFDVKPAFDAWFASDVTFGSMGTLSIPFTIEGGTVKGTMSIALRNSQGVSNAATFTLP